MTAEKYADLYIEAIKEAGNQSYDIDDLYAAFLSGWSNSLLQARKDELDELMKQVKKSIADEFSDA